MDTFQAVSKYVYPVFWILSPEFSILLAKSMHKNLWSDTYKTIPGQPVKGCPAALNIPLHYK
ncbi:hypothetical protein KSU1_C1330 [Candidatus Jettenia caeni]|uniref:Uncharacterized protein n=1 Tax=Candidatus Jettenia caeni TaxID=247490 RepID=I3IMI1_9BACT|nr:hypothetical protein [Candidatus Jettenia sp.]GAB62926.1 hypothetical protein KSU1_C1330 [Candidatus Jettenia caeni]